jgi:hypothetical protein
MGEGESNKTMIFLHPRASLRCVFEHEACRRREDSQRFGDASLQVRKLFSPLIGDDLGERDARGLAFLEEFLLDMVMADDIHH